MRATPQLPEADEEDFFDMANLSPKLTGLPMAVWISERGHTRHDARVKVSLIHGRRAHPDQTASVSVRPAVDGIAGDFFRVTLFEVAPLTAAYALPPWSMPPTLFPIHYVPEVLAALFDNHIA